MSSFGWKDGSSPAFQLFCESKNPRLCRGFRLKTKRPFGEGKRARFLCDGMDFNRLVPEMWKGQQKIEEKPVAFLPFCEFLQIHGGESKQSLHFEFYQSSVICVSHEMLLFRVCEYPLNGLLAHGIDFLALRRVAHVRGSFHVIFPHMPGKVPT